MMKLGKISPLAFSRMKQRGISIDALNDLLAHGQVEKQFDGGRWCTWTAHPQPNLGQ